MNNEYKDEDGTIYQYRTSFDMVQTLNQPEKHTSKINELVRKVYKVVAIENDITVHNHQPLYTTFITFTTKRRI